MSGHFYRSRLPNTKLFRPLVILVVFVYLFIPSVSLDPIPSVKASVPLALLPDTYTGVWRGSAVQVNPSNQWTISLALTNGEVSTIVGTAGFPSVGCGAELTLLDIHGSSVELLEKIVYGNCLDLGIITLTPKPDGSLDYQWHSTNSSTSAVGSVTKVSYGQTNLPDTYVGVWEGSAVQVNPSAQWPILMTLMKGDLGAIVGIAGFAPYQCGAELTLSTVNAGFVELLEDVTYGYCWDLGTITLTPQPDGSLQYRWRSPDNTSNAIGSVKKISAPAGFLPDHDGYNFDNQARPQPSWDIFKQTFSNSSLEYPGGLRKPLANFIYNHLYKTAFNAVCDGMSSTALAYFQNILTRPEGVAETHSITPPDAAWPMIELYQGRQLSKGVQDNRTLLKETYPGVDAVYNQIRAQLPNHINDPLIMVMLPGLKNFIPKEQLSIGHAVVPYRIEDQAGAWGKVYVYDPNHEGDTNRFFYFNFSSSPHTFDYDLGGAITPGGSSFHMNSSIGWIIELVPLSKYLTSDAKVLHDGIFATLIGDGEVLHTNNLGQSIGYQQGVFTSTIPNADIVENGISFPYINNSFGVILPSNTYQVTINSSGSYEYYASSTTYGVDVKTDVANLSSNSITAVETDHLQIGSPGSAAFISSAALGRTLSLQIVGNDGTLERQYDILNISTSGETTLSAKITTSGLTIQTSGIVSNFDLSIQGLEGNAAGWFLHKGIPIAVGSTITINAPHIGPTSTITVITSNGDHWVLDNQVKQIYLPNIRG